MKHIKMNGEIESDEVYVNASLNSRKNSIRIKKFGGDPRHRELKKIEREWNKNKSAISF